MHGLQDDARHPIAQASAPAMTRQQAVNRWGLVGQRAVCAACVRRCHQLPQQAPAPGCVVHARALCGVPTCHVKGASLASSVARCRGQVGSSLQPCQVIHPHTVNGWRWRWLQPQHMGSMQGIQCGQHFQVSGNHARHGHTASGPRPYSLLAYLDQPRIIGLLQPQPLKRFNELFVRHDGFILGHRFYVT